MILSVENYQTLTAQTLTGADLAAARNWCIAVSNGIVQALKPFHPEPVTVTDCILDAPPSRDLLLPVTPVRSVTSIYYHSNANGLVANFTSNDLLDNTDGSEYQLVIDDPINNWSRSGIVRRVWNVWGYENVVPPTRLAPTMGPERGSLKVTFAAGPNAMPPEIEAAAVLATSLLLARKRTGLPLVSESWNGYSASYAGPVTAIGVLQTPDIMSLLGPYLPALRVA